MSDTPHAGARVDIKALTMKPLVTNELAGLVRQVLDGGQGLAPESGMDPIYGP